MSSAYLTFDDTDVTLHDVRGVTETKSSADIVRFVYLGVGSDVFANDSVCYVVVFSGHVWLIPESTKGAYGFKSWARSLDETARAEVGLIDQLPWSWRKRIFLGIPGVEADVKVLSHEEYQAVSGKCTKVENKTLSDVL